jgi:transposase
MRMVGETLSPLYALLKKEIQNDDIAYADETPIHVLKEPDCAPQTPSYVWVFMGGKPERRSLLYHYSPT